MSYLLVPIRLVSDAIHHLHHQNLSFDVYMTAGSVLVSTLPRVKRQDLLSITTGNIQCVWESKLPVCLPITSSDLSFISKCNSGREIVSYFWLAVQRGTEPWQREDRFRRSIHGEQYVSCG